MGCQSNEHDNKICGLYNSQNEMQSGLDLDLDLQGVKPWEDGIVAFLLDVDVLLLITFTLSSLIISYSPLSYLRIISPLLAVAAVAIRNAQSPSWTSNGQPV